MQGESFWYVLHTICLATGRSDYMLYVHLRLFLVLGGGPAIDIWNLGCMVSAFLLACLLYILLTTSPFEIYEFATGHWLFDPEVVEDIPRDVVHLAQMTQRTGQDHDDVALR